MAELFMECEEEELEPWQRRLPEVVDDDDDDDEPIFVGEITSSKTTNCMPQNNINRSNYVSNQQVHNGTLNRSSAVTPYNTGSNVNYKPAVQHSSSAATNSVSPALAVYQPTVRPVLMKAAPRSTPASLPNQSVSRGHISSTGSQTTIRSAASQNVARSLFVPVTTQSLPRPATQPAATQQMSRSVAAQPIIINNQSYIVSSAPIAGSSNVLMGIRPSTPVGQYSVTSVSTGVSPNMGRPIQPHSQVRQALPSRTVSIGVQRPLLQPTQNNNVRLTSGPNSAKLQTPIQVNSPRIQSPHISSPRLQSATQVVNRAGSVMGSSSSNLIKRPATFEINSTNPKKQSLEVLTPHQPSTISSPLPNNILKDTSDSTGYTNNGEPIIKACPKCNVHFNRIGTLKNHIKFCCPDMMNDYFPTTSKQDMPSSPVKLADAEKGKLVMLVQDFYYGKHEGDLRFSLQEQKTNTTFKCCSCLKILKNNIRFMNHMKHHLELEKQSNESWENHTTCQHCYRQYATPFQLQCHIESAHSPYESTTTCKICELSFESEQVLLQHMKDNHKPGEMPYVCQVCSYRSSIFSDVENHFRTTHENTKNLLCPFCLKVIKSATPFMHHYMRHQKKGVHRCTKCRLQFLTCKEKMEHKSQHHRSFRKPKSLEGLPPGTKVTIRASLSSSSGSPSSPGATSKSVVSLVPDSPSTKQMIRPQTNQGKSRSTYYQKKQDRFSISKSSEQPNVSLRNIRGGPGLLKCIECSSVIKDFAAHYPSFVKCRMCRYKTSCSKAYGNHMIRFHSTVSKERLRKEKKYCNYPSGVTLVCLNCDFLTDAAGADDMSKHLNDRQNHSCQVIIEPDAPKSRREKTQKVIPQNTTSKLEADTCRTSKSTTVVQEGATPLQCESTVNDSSLEENKNEKSEAVPEETDKATSENIGKCEMLEGCDKNGEHLDKLKNKDSFSAKEVPETTETKTDNGEKPASCENSSKPDEKEELESENKLEKPSAAEKEEDDVDQKEDAEEAVPFEQFLRKVDEPQSVSSDVSEQGSVHLEPLTPSEVLEHEATEILQKGNPGSSEMKTSPVCEKDDDDDDDDNTTNNDNNSPGSPDASEDRPAEVEEKTES
ncbi:zinc finger protein 280D isoform X2 [Polypterus senegalus]|uniref:zinc finger protein 280D isoform X2 n=1 Tax=Polypterus senegalus TaxID=55291 RepID=UPI001963C305|nr:zinc finger protein 280D isoform X2 [Polypterus senegalus]